MTPVELDRAFRAASARMERDRRLAILSGWVAALCTRTKRMPSLERLLRRPGHSGPAQTVEEQYRTVRMIHAALGGKSSEVV